MSKPKPIKAFGFKSVSDNNVKCKTRVIIYDNFYITIEQTNLVPIEHKDFFVKMGMSPIKTTDRYMLCCKFMSFKESSFFGIIKEYNKIVLEHLRSSRNLKPIDK